MRSSNDHISFIDQVKTAIDNPLLYRHFGSWRYEGGSIVRGLWELHDVFPQELDLEPFLHQHLNHFLVSLYMVTNHVVPNLP